MGVLASDEPWGGDENYSTGVDMPSPRPAWDAQLRYLGEQGGAQPKGQALHFKQPLQVGRHLLVHPWQEAIHFPREACSAT